MLNAAQHTQNRDATVPSDATAHAVFSICYTPRAGSPLALFGRSWFGRTHDGTALEAFSTSSRSRAGSTVTPTPGRYFGLHAPFFGPARLREGVRLDEVRTHLARFAAHRKPIETGPLTLARVRRALVLRPAAPRPELDWLALQCVNAFDSYAAGAATDEVEYPHLTPHQRLLLKSFGQPNVMSEYRFSLALTGPLDDRQYERLSSALHPLVSEFCANGFCIDGLSLVGTTEAETRDRTPAERAGEPIRLLGRYALTA